MVGQKRYSRLSFYNTCAKGSQRKRVRHPSRPIVSRNSVKRVFLVFSARSCRARCSLNDLFFIGTTAQHMERTGSGPWFWVGLSEGSLWSAAICTAIAGGPIHNQPSQPESAGER